jgi:hypothetical protein
MKNNKFNKTYKRRKNKSTRNEKGGKVIASGGFGCVFRPALKCKTKKATKAGDITKLMTKKYAISEYKEISKFKNILKHIPNYTNYFLVDGFTICEPDILSNEDLKNYKEKCRALKKVNIHEDVINSSLDKVLALNMPDGGKDVGDFIDDNKSEDKLIQLNNSLIDLLLNGIIPMNNSHIYHCDIKESNVLVKEQTNKLYTRLIDWGLSCEYKSKELIPKQLTRRPFQYNVPYSIILFNKEFINRYNKFLKKNHDINYFAIREFVVNYILIWINIRGPGHLKVINNQMNKLFINQLPVLDDTHKESFIEYEFTYHYIIEYISRILEKYTKKNKMYLKEYFKEVFIHNIDIWGFVMIYMPFISFLYDKYQNLNVYEKQLFHQLKYIIVHFLLETPCDIINTTQLSIELKKINNLFKESDGLASVSGSVFNTDASFIKSNYNYN